MSSSLDKILWDESTVDIDILEAEDVAIDIGTEGMGGNKFLLADDEGLTELFEDSNTDSGSDDADGVGQDRCRDCVIDTVTPSLEITSLCISRSCLTRLLFWGKILLQIRQTFSESPRTSVEGTSDCN